MAGSLEFRILGSLEASRDGRAVPLGSRKQRALLALLLLRANEVVATDLLVEELWPADRPATARNNVEVYVSRLRVALGRDVVVTQAPGYLLRVEPRQIDAARFEQLVATARDASDVVQASRLLAEALAIWRGTPLADFVYAPFAQSEIARLEELRLTALEDRIEADLALGGHRDVAGELARLVAEHPYRERLHAQLMLALYRSGRQADALEHYRRAARVLADELGVEPGPELRERERAILSHDPSLRLRPLRDGNLPAPAGPLVGRRGEVDEISRLLERRETRLVTITGAGGSGKTRLALEVAAAVERRSHMPAFFVDLAAIADPELVLAAVGRAVGLEDDGESPLADALRALLRRRPLLLVLDNFEHLLPAAGDVARLLGDLRSLTVLATSRTPLRVRAERRYPLEPLPLDDAVALFVERARVQPSPAAEQICRRLDGLPLAIELAAARTDVLEPEAIVERLDRRFSLLTRGARDLPARQQTLRAAVDWSYTLLAGEERRALRRLAVFAGGCTSEAAAEVCAATVDHLAELTDASLVRHDGGRFTMLDTIREYALERLRDSGDEDATRGRHAEYYLRHAEQVDLAVEARLRKPPVALDAELDNLREALRWSRGELRLRLAAALGRYWDVRGHLREGDEWLRTAISGAHTAPPALLAAALRPAAYIAARLGDLPRAAELAERSLELSRSVGDGRGIARALAADGFVAARRGDDERWAALAAERLDVAAEAGDREQVASAAMALGPMATRRGDYALARRLFEQGLAEFRAIGDELMVGQALCLIGFVEVLDTRYSDAREPLEESLRIAHRIGYREAAAYSLTGLADLAVGEGDVERAERLLAAADALVEEVGAIRLPLLEQLDHRTRSAVVAARGEPSLEAARERARNTDLDDTVGTALGLTSEP